MEEEAIFVEESWRLTYFLLMVTLPHFKARNLKRLWESNHYNFSQQCHAGCDLRWTKTLTLKAILNEKDYVNVYQTRTTKGTGFIMIFSIVRCKTLSKGELINSFYSADKFNKNKCRFVLNDLHLTEIVQTALIIHQQNFQQLTGKIGSIGKAIRNESTF